MTAIEKILAGINLAYRLKISYSKVFLRAVNRCCYTKGKFLPSCSPDLQVLMVHKNISLRKALPHD